MGLIQIFSRAGDGNRDPDGAKYTKQINPPQVSSPMKDTTILLWLNCLRHCKSSGEEVGNNTAAEHWALSKNQTQLQEVVKGVFLSALNNRHDSSSVTLPVPVNVYQDVHAYVGETTIAMSDGSVLKFRGSEMVKSTEQLDTSSSSIL